MDDSYYIFPTWHVDLWAKDFPRLVIDSNSFAQGFLARLIAILRSSEGLIGLCLHHASRRLGRVAVGVALMFLEGVMLHLIRILVLIIKLVAAKPANH